MLVWTIFSLFNRNQERANDIFLQVRCASSLTNAILLFFSGINGQKGERTYVFRFSFSL